MVGQSTSSPAAFGSGTGSGSDSGPGSGVLPVAGAQPQPLASVIFGHWTERHTSNYCTNLSASVTVEGALLPSQLAGHMLRVRVERLVAGTDPRATVQR